VSEQNQSRPANQSHTQNRPKARVAPVVERAGAQVELAQLPRGRIGAEESSGQDDLDALLKGPAGVLGGGSLENQVACLKDPRLQTVQRQALAAQVGRVQGNRHLQRVLTSLKREANPTESSLVKINHVASIADSHPGFLPAFAGTPAMRAAPGGLGFILSQGSGGSLGVSGGLTLIRHAAAFTQPTFTTRNSSVRRGHQVEHFAEVQPTTAADATHDSYYPGSGDHERPGMTHTEGGRAFQHFWGVSRQISDLIRRGEQEHLDDALRAYELTYRRIADEINGMAGQRFGPAQNPAEADQLAETELARRLPSQLGTNPANWVRMLDTLLSATQVRDRNGWHALGIGPPRTVGNRVIHPVQTTGSINIDQVSSSQVVSYPAAPASQPVLIPGRGTSGPSPMGDFPEPRGEERLAVAAHINVRGAADQANVFRYGTDPCTSPPTHIVTMDDYIRLVERAEQAYPGTSAANMITRIRRTKYSSFAFGRFIRAPESQGPLLPRDPLTAADVQAFVCDIMISMPGGGYTDPSHILVGLDVRRYPGGTVLAPSGISATAATTWAGDVGSAYGEYVAQEKPALETRDDQQTRLNYWNELSPYHDLMANIDGLAMSATDMPAQWQFDAAEPLSRNLRRFFHPAAGSGRQRRFTLFAGVEGIQYRGRGSSLTLTPASRSFIEQQIELFTRGYTPTLIQPHLHRGGQFGSIFYWARYSRRAGQKEWFVNRFIDFVQNGLRQENP